MMLILNSKSTLANAMRLMELSSEWYGLLETKKPNKAGSVLGILLKIKSERHISINFEFLIQCPINKLSKYVTCFIKTCIIQVFFDSVNVA